MRPPVSYVRSNPYVNSAAENYRKHFHDLAGKSIITEGDLRQFLTETKERPDILLLWGFVTERSALAGLCREHGINTATWEDGFFPHYGTIHVDPLGFCWESSLTRMVFRGCSAPQREVAREARAIWATKPAGPLPSEVRKPFALWPLQLIGDKVNDWDLRVPEWAGLIRHFRSKLPAHFQLVLKDHPFAAPKDLVGLDELVAELPNTVRVPKDASLAGLLRECDAVGGANSSVLYEARLMHHKPTYAYARSWFTNHDELFVPVSRDFSAYLPRRDWLDNPATMRTARLDDYTDWFLAQLLGRQIGGKTALEDPDLFRAHVGRLSYQSYLENGEAIFEPFSA